MAEPKIPLPPFAALRAFHAAALHGRFRDAALSLGVTESSISHQVRQLEERLGRRISIFSYPHGGHADFTSATVRLVREAGYRLACTAYPGLTRTWTDRYRLPRVVVEDWDGDEFARRLRDWLPG